jgi:hypothetical protein
VLKHVGVLSAAKIMALLGLVFGLIYGAFFSALLPMMPGVSAFAALGAVALIIGGILFGAIFGFIYGAVVAFLYNVFAGWVGGIQLDLV